MIRTLIVDDEPIARRVIREELADFPEFEVTGEAANGGEALGLIRDQKPDLVFLDLQMPVMNGLDVVREIGGPSLPLVVIVTAFDQHAIEAFEAGAIDYLLKPVRRERLELTLRRATDLRGNPRMAAESLAKLSNVAAAPARTMSRRIVGRNGSEYLLLDSADVLAFEAERELVWIVLQSRRLMATHTLRETESKLQGLPFQRIRRNTIVNLNHVRKMSALSSNRWLLTLSNSQEFVVSKRMAHDVRHILQW